MSAFRLDGKVAVVTGASRGIGRQVALDFAAAGARLVLGARGRERLDAMVAEIVATGAEAIGVVADVGVIADCERLVEAAAGRFGMVDVLVNSAAVSGPSELLRDVDPADWERTIAVNLTGTWACIRYALKYMMEQRSGAIVNVSSFNGKFPMIKRSPYAASKLGIVGITRGLALEVGPWGIRVNTVSPGPTEGERVDEVIRLMAATGGIGEEAVRGKLLAMSPLHRMADNHDVARMVLYLASEAGRAMTGQDINVTAGVVMY